MSIWAGMLCFRLCTVASPWLSELECYVSDCTRWFRHECLSWHVMFQTVHTGFSISVWAGMLCFSLYTLVSSWVSELVCYVSDCTHWFLREWLSCHVMFQAVYSGCPERLGDFLNLSGYICTRGQTPGDMICKTRKYIHSSLCWITLAFAVLFSLFTCVSLYCLFPSRLLNV